ncbi:C25 family cysteine peptidase [Thermodesulfobacteriota bacterium]
MLKSKSKVLIAGAANLCLILCLTLSCGADQSGTPGLAIEVEGDRVRVELVTRNVEFEQVSFGSSPWTRPVVRDYEHSTIHEPGHPMLPVKVALIEVPLNASISYSIDGIETSIRRTGPVAPAPARPLPDVSPDIGFELPREYTDLLHKKDDLPAPSIYGSNTPYPDKPVRIVEAGIMRGRRYAQVLLHPVQYRPAEGSLLVHNRISLTITFEETAETKSASRAETKPPFPDYGLIDAYRVEMSKTGMAEIGHNDLDGAGLDLTTVDPDYFQVYNMGQQVAIRVSAQGGGVGSFGVDDTIRFYALKSQTTYPGIETTKYSDVNFYWVIVGDAPGLRMAEHDGTPGGAGATPEDFYTTLHTEENLSYQSTLALQDDEDNWFWGLMMAGWPNTYEIELPHVSQAAGDDAQITIHLWGLTDYTGVVNPDHHIQILVNNTLVADNTFSGRNSYLETFNFSNDLLLEGTNEVKVNMPGVPGATYEMILMDWFEISYRKTFDADDDALACGTDVVGVQNRIEINGFGSDPVSVFDITDATTPVEVINVLVEEEVRSYRAVFDDTPAEQTDYYAVGDGSWLVPDSVELDSPSSLWDASNRADYIIIAHDTLLSEASQLAAYREARGLAVEVVDAADVYDEFNYGNIDLTAIRNFLAYAYFEWSTPEPAYTLLFGDGHFDYKDYSGLGGPILIPPKMIGITGAMIPSDNYFACIEGDDYLPELMLGRLPVRTPAEAQGVIDKITGYESDPDTSDFDDQVLVIADDEGMFEYWSDQLIDNYICPPHEAETVYVTGCPDSNDCRQAIIDEINSGKVLVNYRGHGSTLVWTAESIFYNYDVESLTNIDALPIFFSGTCLDGDFATVAPVSGYFGIGEELLRDPDGGSIAGFHASGFSDDDASYNLNRGFFHVYFNMNMRVLGEALQEARLFFINASDDIEVLHYNLLLGDPALRIVESAADADGDGVTDNEDNCPDDDDPGQENFDGDCLGNACDPDDDNDSWDDEDDCDDFNPDVYPGAEEVCNGVDDDCDLVVPADEADDDEDGWMECENDCNDTDPDVNPGIIENKAEGNCEDGIDNDCDTFIDLDDPDCKDCFIGVTLS